MEPNYAADGAPDPGTAIAPNPGTAIAPDAGAAMPPIQQPVAQAQPVAPVQPTTNRKTPDERKELLGRAVQTQIAGGARIESQSDYQAVFIKGRRPNHLLHFIVGALTFSLWWFVWAGIAIFGGEKRMIAQVDEFGNVSVQRL